jgi:hypothetical protein
MSKSQVKGTIAEAMVEEMKKEEVKNKRGSSLFPVERGGLTGGG